MTKPIDFIAKPITTGKVVEELQKSKKLNPTHKNAQSFKDIFNEITKENNIKFSAHALKRLEDRNINLSKKDISDIRQAVNKADNKGLRESLVVMKDISFIVNIKNKTIITAVDSQNMKENVITNIDGAVFI